MRSRLALRSFCRVAPGLLLALTRPGTPASAQTPTATPLSVIRGRVELRHVAHPPAPRTDVAQLGMPAPHAHADRTRSVVYLEVAPQAAFEPVEHPRAVLDQRDQTFVPYVLPITVGTTVEFPNNDQTYHNVFSLSKTRRFDLGRYPRGETKSVRFDQPGVVRVFCEIHSQMSAFILVFAHRYYTLTDAEGRYQLPAVPPGTYTVMVWNDGEVRERHSVRVVEGARTEDVDFVIE